MRNGMAGPAIFTRQSLAFLLKASRQKRPDWLERNHTEYERLLLNPLRNLAAVLKSELGRAAPGYHFPQKGIGRLKRPPHRVKEDGRLYRDWLHYAAARPRTSRFETNPNLYFLLNPSDPKDPVLLAGGLYMPSFRQLRAVREAIAADASPFEKLFRSREFSSRFKRGFSPEKTSSRPPRGFAPDHPRMDWLKLQAFFVWKPYSLREFTAPGFAWIVARDCRQILRLNELLEQAVSGKLSSAQASSARSSGKRLSSLIDAIDAPRRKMDF